MTKVLVDGREVGIGDAVGFKSDIEQYGIVVGFKYNEWTRQRDLIVKPASDHFHGEYLHGVGGSGPDSTTTLHASDCW